MCCRRTPTAIWSRFTDAYVGAQDGVEWSIVNTRAQRAVVVNDATLLGGRRVSYRRLVGLKKSQRSDADVVAWTVWHDASISQGMSSGRRIDMVGMRTRRLSRSSPIKNAGEMLCALPEIYSRDSMMVWCLDVLPALHRKIIH